MDTTESIVEWNCDSHHGTVPLQSGIIKIVEGEIVSGNFKMKMDSIKDLDIDYPLMRHTLENTLRSEFFFDTKNFPTTDFYIDHVIPKEKNNQLIAGDLWIRGLVNCIRFNARVQYDQKQFTAVSDSFQINRIDWNVTIYSQQEAKSDEAVIVSDNIGFVIYLKGNKR
jgi:polyisoprenoid-binding protein YceI